jgi:hypothetical protein
MEQAGAEVASARLVTLVGPGGVGKTRLAAQVGADLVDKFPDGVWMFELARLDRPDGLEASMLATLARSGTSVIDARQELLALIRAWRPVDHGQLRTSAPTRRRVGERCPGCWRRRAPAGDQSGTASSAGRAGIASDPVAGER